MDRIIPNDSDRDFPPGPKAGDEDLARMIASSEGTEKFDDASRFRFGKIISSAVTKRRKR